VQDGSPRSPSRLRYVRKESAAGAAAALATAPQLPDFLQVQELPPGVLHEVSNTWGQCCAVLPKFFSWLSVVWFIMQEAGS
jgi:hypothetical protein